MAPGFISWLKQCFVFVVFLLCVLFFSCEVKANSIHGADINDMLERPDFTYVDSYRVEEGYCAPYNGNVCKQFVNASVWYSIEDPSGGLRNEQITTALWEELISNLTGLCREAAEKLLCAYAFPRCHLENRRIIKEPLCFQDCQAAHLQFCYKEWTLLEQKKKRNIFLKNRAHFRLPNCTVLPQFDPSMRRPSCFYLGLADVDESEVSYDCRNGNGRYYMGTMNMTKSGIPCQRWDIQHPHKHIQPPLVFDQLTEGENYCRNVGGNEPEPWCYTMDESVRWQHCDIPNCSGNESPSGIK